MAEPNLTPLPKQMPTEVELRADEFEVGFTPRELRQIKESCGRSWSQVVADETDDSDRFKVFAWLKLRREGHTPTFDDMDDVVIRIVAAPPDPTSAAPSTNSPGSVATGA
jgi:hypothetical protein